MGEMGGGEGEGGVRVSIINFQFKYTSASP